MQTFAITLGDVNGIGPEVSLKAVLGRRWPSDTRFVLIGSHSVASQTAKPLGFKPPPAWTPQPGTPPPRKVVVWEPDPEASLPWRPGKIRADAAMRAVTWIREAVQGCQDGRFAGLITAPICKEGLKKAGLNMPGHTEYLAELTKTKRFAMMLIGGPLRVVLATRHIPLRCVADALTEHEILDAIRITHEALPWLGFPGGSIGVCGLNPHAGDGGALGDEEQTLIRPAITRARRARINAIGPIAPDTIFHQAINGAYDAIVAMYHDQGLGPLKMLAFDEGINVTLGLPIVRTSPDHGTAFNIAGQNRANPGSMIAAINLARHLARQPNPWQG